jgi:PAS domain-containing protein
VLRALRSGDGEARELAIRRADGDIRWVVVSVRPIRRDGLARSYAVMSMLDVTDRRALAREREVSQALQRAVLPARLPEVRGITLAADYMPAAEGAKVGGDWYDAVSLPDGCVTLVIGDVEGHDVAAAGLMGQIRSVIRGYALEGHPPAQALEHANRYLLDLGVDRIVTVALVQLHPAEQVGHRRERRAPSAAARATGRGADLPRPGAGPAAGHRRVDPVA